MDLADRVVVLREGQIEQIGTPETLDARPASAFVFDFLGDSNQLPCQIEGGRALFDGFSAPAVVTPGAGPATTAWFRPHETRLSSSGEGLQVTVADILIKGAMVRLECRSPNGRLYEADYPKGTVPSELIIGANALLSPERVFVFPNS